MRVKVIRGMWDFGPSEQVRRLLGQGDGYDLKEWAYIVLLIVALGLGTVMGCCIERRMSNLRVDQLAEPRMVPPLEVPKGVGK